MGGRAISGNKYTSRIWIFTYETTNKNQKIKKIFSYKIGVLTVNTPEIIYKFIMKNW
jgi:hypothetical protein